MKSLSARSNDGSIENDPLISYIASNLAALRRVSVVPLARRSSAHSLVETPASGASATSGSNTLPLEVQQWEVQWEDIRVMRLVGRGAFGRVSAAAVAAAAALAASTCCCHGCCSLLLLLLLPTSQGHVMLLTAGVPGQLEANAGCGQSAHSCRQARLLLKCCPEPAHALLLASRMQQLARFTACRAACAMVQII